MAAAVLRLAKKPVLDTLIEEAGREQQQATAHNNRYKHLRKEIESMMEIPEGEKFTERVSEGFKAKLYYPNGIRVVPEKLYKLDRDLFWRVVNVSVKDIEGVLDRDAFFTCTEEAENGIPRLTISAVKED